MILAIEARKDNKFKIGSDLFESTKSSVTKNGETSSVVELITASRFSTVEVYDSIDAVYKPVALMTPEDILYLESIAESNNKADVPIVVTMRQARLALLQSNLLSVVDNAIASGTDEAMKIEWEYATEVRRDWQSLIAMSTALGMNESHLDELFILAKTL